VGDFDNDGFRDLFTVTGYGRAILYHNNGMERYRRYRQGGCRRRRRVVQSAGWFDYDKDGWLDLLVTNSSSGRQRTTPIAAKGGLATGRPAIAGNYKGQKTKLYHTSRWNIHATSAMRPGGEARIQGMGVVLADFNNDGWPILPSATTRGRISCSQQHNGTFEDVSFLRACCGRGRTLRGRDGIDAAEWRDGCRMCTVTHLDFELNRLTTHQNGTFDDDTFRSGIGNKQFC